jgi:hypothetical protein
MLRVLEFVDKSDGVVCERNPAVALCVDDQVIFAKAEFARALARLKECSRAEVSPIDAALFELPKRFNMRIDYGNPFLGNVPGLPQRDARCDEEAACSADYNEARSTGFVDAFDKAICRAGELIGIVRRRPIGRDDGVRALDNAGSLYWIAEIVLDCGDILEFLHLLGVRAAAITMCPRSTSSLRMMLPTLPVAP